MPSRTLTELFHIVAGLAATVAIVAVAAWAYPLARHEIRVVGWMAAAIVVAMGVRPLRRAWAVDHQERGGE
ncbi:hypothetical protein M9980_02495 [Sphingomonas donggukensis]|uniref:Uncharacterized protein n=1 Tax=Sphingomonas donggukensis TaxID=2949093 RepID=A0ABY4TUQ2_9SPHN|nr:hypothetical protein [Sphingomonas donggukensis]URW76121.1 hypothetical protein M9980_02495 [Sphingomonas donggukensis]